MRSCTPARNLIGDHLDDPLTPPLGDPLHVPCCNPIDNHLTEKPSPAIILRGGILVQNCGDSDIERAVIEAAKERKLQTNNISGTRRRPRS
ncbi:hypothetical protein QJS10_CPB17g00599 [Acorus calamus]|uniref:Uncharacterized protein n=1 Tax=Acorus calamus TaxID=4465 RepID=A0AAV9CQT6_ACOCL|nr:hypothetical protein QJS10_CPB17g00599 [Acorus calamus]